MIEPKSLLGGEGHEQSHEERQIPIEQKVIHQSLKVPGLTLFSYDLKTKLIKAVEGKKIHPVDMNDPKRVMTQEKIQHSPNHMYIQALNYKNAERKFNQILKGER